MSGVCNINETYQFEINTFCREIDGKALQEIAAILLNIRTKIRVRVTAKSFKA